MPIMTWIKDETVAIITMTNGENRQNLVFAKTLNAMLDEIIADKSISGMIITSNDEKNFSQGIDVQWIMDNMQKNNHQPVTDFINEMDNVFKKTASLSGAGNRGDQRPCFRQWFDNVLRLRFSIHAVGSRVLLLSGSKHRHSFQVGHERFC